MDHDNLLFFAFFIDAFEFKPLGHIEVQLNGGHLLRATYRIGGHKIYFWPVHSGFTETVHDIFCAAFFHDCFYFLFGALPSFPRAYIFLKMFRIVKRQTYTQTKTKCAIKLVYDIPYGEHLFFNLIFSAKNMRVILSDRTNARETA